MIHPQALKILTSPSRQTKSPDNSNTLNMFNNNTDTNFKTALKQFCDGVMLDNYFDHKFQWPQEGLNCNSLGHWKLWSK